jgi:hypothetical protein
MPATYVVDAKGKIGFALGEPDYRKRLEPGSALAVLSSVASGKVA